jgi:hypothetical protein
MFVRMKMSQISRFVIVSLAVALSTGCLARKPEMSPGRQIPAPPLVPGVIAAMNTPGYWISRHPDPDRAVMTAAQIAAFNDRIEVRDRSVTDLVSFDAGVEGETLKNDLGDCLSAIRGRGYYLASGRQPDEPWWRSLEDNLNQAAIVGRVPVRFGLVTGFCDHRILPTEEGLYRENLDLNFDRLQDSTLDVGAPVAVLHQSKDGLWLYAVGETMRGWVAAENVALCEREALRIYVRAEKFAVVTAAKADLYADENLRVFLGRAQMGTRLPMTRDDNPLALAVLVPNRGQNGQCSLATAFVQRTEASLGYLPYTPRTILTQAFRLLHTPYGWGGLFGEQDCSRFVQEVFASVGLVLPRNSSEQALVGRSVYEDPQADDAEERLRALREDAVPALTVVCMNGHIMLFLGFVDGRPYVIHDLWGYAVDESITAIVNRVAVTPLDLGNGSSGTLLDRVNSLRVFDAVSQSDR